jgi:hypothetical protein
MTETLHVHHGHLVGASCHRNLVKWWRLAPAAGTFAPRALLTIVTMGHFFGVKAQAVGKEKARKGTVVLAWRRL